MLKKDSISIYQLIYRRFIRQSIIPFILILTLLLALFLLNMYQSTINKEALQTTAKKSFQEIAKQTSEVINQRFNLEKLRLYQLRDTLQLILSKKESFIIDDGKWVDKGGFFIHNDSSFKKELKTSVYSTNILNIKKEDTVLLSALKALVPSVARSVDGKNDLITAAWVNIGKNYALAYPPISPEDELSPELDVTQYSFYYNGDPSHNPNKEIIYSPLYKEPWAVDAGELGAYLIPIYEKDSFKGVIGLTLSAEGVADVIKNLKLPFDAYAQLIDENGYLIVTSDDDKSYADFSRHSFYKLYQNPDFKDRSLMKIKPDTKLMNSCTIYSKDINGTNLTLRLIAKNGEIFKTVDKLTNQTLIIGVVLALIMSIIYIISIISGVSAIRSLALKLSDTLKKVLDFSSNLGQKDDIKLQHTDIKEFEDLNYNLTCTHNKLLDLIIKDEQTQLYNRHKLLQDLADEDGKSLMIFELNNYKTLFNLYGLDAVSILINGVVERLNRCKNLQAYRLEDDTFALLQDTQEIDNFFKLAEQIAHLNFSYESIKLNPQLFSGVAISHPLIEQAGIALLEARQRNSATPVKCNETESIKEKFEENLDWSNRFNKALKERRFVPYFQPIYNIKEQKVSKFESLVRMREGDDIIAPFHFLQVAAQMGKITEITKIMIQKVFAIASRHQEISFNINVSFRDFTAFDLLLYIQENQHAYGVNPSQITFELLETDAIQEIEPVIKTLAKLKKEGYKIAIDDFGTGHSNFAHLMMMQVDFIKIDGQFIKNINTDPNSAAIAQTITKFSKLMGAESVAEFVADEAILKRVKKFGIDYAQGYFIAPPMPSDEILSFLELFNHEKIS